MYIYIYCQNYCSFHPYYRFCRYLYYCYSDYYVCLIMVVTIMIFMIAVVFCYYEDGYNSLQFLRLLLRLLATARLAYHSLGPRTT